MLCRECAQDNQCGERRYVKDHMQRIRQDAVAFGQESVRRPEHHLIARRALCLWVKQVWNPPGRQLADE